MTDFFFICRIKSPQCTDKYSKKVFSIAIFLPRVLMYQKHQISLPVGYKTATPKTGDWERLWRQFRTPSLAKNRFLRRWCRGFVLHRKWNLTLLAHQNTGKENCYRKIFFATLISTLGRFNRANKKKSVIYTLRRKSAFPLLHYYCARFVFYVLAVFFNGCDWRTSFFVLPRYVKRIVSVTTQTLNTGFHWRISMP